MACYDWLTLHGYTPEKLQDDPSVLPALQTMVNNEGINCINNNQTFCGNFCKDLTKSESACYSCLANAASCPPNFNAGTTNSCRTSTGINCNTNPNEACCKVGCCPVAKSAVACAACVASSGQSIDAFISCYNQGGLSTTILIVIIVCSIVGAVIIGATIYLVIRLKKKQKAQEKLVTNLQKRGASQETINAVENINYAEVNPEVYQQVNRNLVLTS